MLSLFQCARWWVLVGLFFGCGTLAHAEVLSADNLPENLDGRLEILQEPPASDWSLDNALDQPDADWKPLASATPNFSFDSAAYWVRFRVHNPTSERTQLIFDVAQPLQDYIDAWVLDKSGATLQSWQTGDRRPASQRPFLYRAFGFPITIPNGQEVLFIARYDTHDGLYDPLPMQLLDLATFFQQKDQETLWYGFYYGATIILLLYNLTVGLVTRERNFLWYSLYLSVFLAWNLGFRGYLAIGPLANAPTLNNMLLGTHVGGIFITLIVFSQKFLPLKQMMPRTNRLLTIVAFAMLVPMMLSMQNRYAVAFAIETPLALIVLVEILVIGTYLSWKGNRSARIYLLAWVFLITSAIAYYGRIHSIIPPSWFLENALNIGSMIELLVLSLALADRISELKQERMKDQAYLIERERGMNQELQQQVEEKTRELQTLADRLEQESITDSLTGLRNRRTFETVLSQAIQYQDRQYAWTCFAQIDLDHFKRFNDQFGHPAGDAILERLGALLRDFFQRADDHLFRLGGEEFGVVFRVESPEDATAIMDRFQVALAQAYSTGLPDGAKPVTASIGVACVAAGTTTTTTELYRFVDQLLYRCKETGRNRYCVEVLDSPSWDAPHKASCI